MNKELQYCIDNNPEILKGETVERLLHFYEEVDWLESILTNAHRGMMLEVEGVPFEGTWDRIAAAAICAELCGGTVEPRKSSIVNWRL